MTRRERLMASLRGQPVDRPSVCFYELNGLDEDPSDPDPYNIFSDPSWRPLLELTRQRTDCIVMRGARMKNAPPDPLADATTAETVETETSRFVTQTVRLGSRTLVRRTRRDRDTLTTWTLEHPLKDASDLKAWLETPLPEAGGEPDVEPILQAEHQIADAGIVMLDIPDPLCLAAEMFEMGQYTVIALTERRLFRQLLERHFQTLLPRVEAVSRALPGRLWRVIGPEYASPPYLPPSLFREYVLPYDTAVVQAIQRHGGFARVHSHGRLKEALDVIAATGCVGLDPIEPPPLGDVSLAYVRRRYGRQLVLFGNLEIRDIESLPTRRFEQKVRTALEEGTAGQGRGFVLMPSAAPIGRRLPELTLRNYEKMVELVEAL
jgi:hypothetical protein